MAYLSRYFRTCVDDNVSHAFVHVTVDNVIIIIKPSSYAFKSLVHILVVCDAS